MSNISSSDASYLILASNYYRDFSTKPSYPFIKANGTRLSYDSVIGDYKT